MKKISVVVSAFNEEKNLPRCLEALTNQTFPKSDYEILVVDNNSTDKTEEIAKSFGARVVVEKRQGNTFAVSTGYRLADGEVIASTDADTIVSKNWLEVINNAFEDKKVVGATGNIKTDTKNKLKKFLLEKSYESFLRINFLIGKPHFSGFNFAVRKQAFDEIGGIDETFIMSPDVDLGVRIVKKGKVIFVKDMIVNTSARRWEETPVDAFWTYFKGYIYSIWLRKPPPVKQKVIR